MPDEVATKAPSNSSPQRQRCHRPTHSRCRRLWGEGCRGHGRGLLFCSLFQTGWTHSPLPPDTDARGRSSSGTQRGTAGQRRGGEDLFHSTVDASMLEGKERTVWTKDKMAHSLTMVQRPDDPMLSGGLCASMFWDTATGLLQCCPLWSGHRHRWFMSGRRNTWSNGMGATS